MTSRIRTDTELLVRATVGFFFVSLWGLGGVILTPELKTDAAWIPWLQLALAGCLIWRRTMPITGLGIVFLFSYATAQYGLFHLADYPVFLGVATYLILRGLDVSPYGIRPLDIVRWTAASPDVGLRREVGLPAMDGSADRGQALHDDGCAPSSSCRRPASSSSPSPSP